MKKEAEKEQLKRARGGIHGSETFLEIINEAAEAFKKATNEAERQEIANNLVETLQTLHF